ncbi:hypothetical protein D3C71_1226290 [compost metagenome]
MLLPLFDFMIQALAPGRAVGQPGQRVDQCLLSLLFKVLAVTLGLLLHMGDPLGQAVQARSDLLLALIALFLVLVHGAQQAFEMVFQYVLEIFQVRGFLHAALQAIDLFADLRVHLSRSRTVVGVSRGGGLQVALERFETLVQSLQIGFELMLAAVGNGQHQCGEVVENRQQFVPVQTVFQTIAHGFGLRAMTLGQCQVVEQPQQRVFDVAGHRAVGGLGGIRKCVENVVFGWRLIDDGHVLHRNRR